MQQARSITVPKPRTKSAQLNNNPFMSEDGRPRRLRGAAIYSGSLRLAELSARIGFDAVWIEKEHSAIDWNQAEGMCIAIENGGGIPIIRVPSNDRRDILLSLEVGARIVVVPMINRPEQARQVVRHGKFPPLGERGYNSRTRGMGYGLNGMSTSSLDEVNQRNQLFVQIETREAVENLQAICAVEGIAGIFIGPGDLSLSYGWMGQLDNTSLIDTVLQIIRQAHDAGKTTGILVGPGPLLEAAIEAGCQLLIVGGDVADLTSAWSQLLNRVK